MKYQYISSEFAKSTWFLLSFLSIPFLVDFCNRIRLRAIFFLSLSFISFLPSTTNNFNVSLIACVGRKMEKVVWDFRQFHPHNAYHIKCNEFPEKYMRHRHRKTSIVRRSQIIKFNLIVSSFRIVCCSKIDGLVRRPHLITSPSSHYKLLGKRKCKVEPSNTTTTNFQQTNFSQDFHSCLSSP